MAYLVSGTDLTSVANAIRTAGGTSAQLEFPSGFVTAIGNLSGGGGGATNIVTGKFTGSNAEKGTVKTITLNYSGSGFPIACLIYPTTGTYKSGSDVYASTEQKAIVMHTFVKANTSEAPDYGTSSVEKNQAMILVSYKNSSSDATNITSTFSKNGMEFTSYSAQGSSAQYGVRFSSATSMGVFIKDADYGFLAEAEYEYYVIYSS